MGTLARIIELKERLYKTDAEFERAVGVSPKMFDKWTERGSKSYIKRIVKIAHALNTSVAYLLCETDDPTSKTNNVSQVQPQKSDGPTLNVQHGFASLLQAATGGDEDATQEEVDELSNYWNNIIKPRRNK